MNSVPSPSSTEAVLNKAAEAEKRSVSNTEEKVSLEEDGRSA
jgi:hypothetical protein